MTAKIKMSLQNILVHHYPMHKEFFKDLESKTANGFFKKYPSQTYLKRSQSDGRPKKKAKEILEAIDSNGWNKTDYQKEQNESVISFINSLEHLESQIDSLDKTLDNLIEVAGYPLKTINGIDTVLTATFIANIGDVNRFPKANKLAKLAGIALLEHSSGESQRNYSIKLGNRELNKAFYYLALTQIRKNMNPIIDNYYQSNIKEGRKKKQAMVYVERRLVNIVFS